MGAKLVAVDLKLPLTSAASVPDAVAFTFSSFVNIDGKPCYPDRKAVHCL